jgi:hypothetical protein
MVRIPFFVLFGARMMQGFGVILTLYGLFIVSVTYGITQKFSITFLIPISGIILIIWGSKILHDRGIDFRV